MRPEPDTAGIFASAASVSRSAVAASPPLALMSPAAMPSLSSSSAFKQMLRRNPLVVHADGDGLRALQEALGAIGEFFEVHMRYPCPFTNKGNVAILPHKGIGQILRELYP
jgi:hypothetical protein